MSDGNVRVQAEVNRQSAAANGAAHVCASVAHTLSPCATISFRVVQSVGSGDPTGIGLAAPHISLLRDGGATHSHREWRCHPQLVGTNGGPCMSNQDPYSQDPNQQYGGQQTGQDPNQQYGQDPSQQGGQYGQDPNQQYGSQQGSGMSQDPNQQMGGQQGGGMAQDPNAGQGGMLGGARQQAQDQVDSAIDQFANRVPGGQQVSQQAKDQAGNALDDIEKEAENRMG